MTDQLPHQPPADRAVGARSNRARRLTVAGLVAAGLATGGAFAADAAFASGTSTTTTPSAARPSSGTARPAPPRGGPGPGADGLDGVVTAASSTGVTVRSDFGVSRSYRITSTTKIHSGPGTTASASTLVVGARVGVHGSRSGNTYTAADIDVHRAHLDGVVTAITGDQVTVTDHDGFTRTIDLASSTTFTKDGAKSDRSALTVGSVVGAQGKVDSDRTSLDAATVDIRTKDTAPPAGPGGRGGPGAPPAANGPGRGGPPAGARPAPKAPASGTSSAPSNGAGHGS